MALGDGALRQKLIDTATEYDTRLHEFIDGLNLTPEQQALWESVDGTFHNWLDIVEEGAGVKLFQRIRERWQAWRAAHQAKKAGG